MLKWEDTYRDGRDFCITVGGLKAEIHTAGKNAWYRWAGGEWMELQATDAAAAQAEAEALLRAWVEQVAAGLGCRVVEAATLESLQEGCDPLRDVVGVDDSWPEGV